MREEAVEASDKRCVLYRIGGLLVAVAAPEDPLFHRVSSGTPDIVIGEGSGESMAAAWAGAGEPIRYGDVLLAEGADGGYVVRFPEWFDAVVAPDGRNIQVFEKERWSGLSRAVMSAVVPLALLAHGRVALHASAVDLDGTALVLAGDRGAGKSTMATALCLQGARLLADDITFVRLDGDGVAVVEPSGGATRLFPDVAARMGTAAVDALAHKQLLGAPFVNAASGGSRLAGLHVLERRDGDGPVRTPATGADGVLVVLRYMLGEVGHSGRGRALQHQIASAIARQAEVTTVAWPPDASLAERIAQRLIQEPRASG